MRTQCTAWLAAIVLNLAIIGGCPARAQESPDTTPPATVGNLARSPAQVIETSLSFLVNDVAKWRADRGCATCHHGTMTVWALSEAKAQGFHVPADSFADIFQWTRDQLATDMHTIRDPRPGWNLASTPLIYLAVMSHNLPVLSREQIKQVALHLARHQEEDGSFLLPIPAANGPPPTWESSETIALWALLAWEPSVVTDPKEAVEVTERRDRTVAWLSKVTPTNTTQSTALRLLLDVRLHKPIEQIQSGIEQLLKRQNSDGGWSQTVELGSDAYATGQSLYVLSFAGVSNDRPEIQRAVAFLAATQREDGSWLVIPHNHPGVETTKNPVHWEVPITYFGAAWATLGLVRSVPSPPDTPLKQQRAFENIRAFHGKYDVDEKNPDRPVVVVDLRYYEVSDTEVGKFANWLQAFPQMATLHFKSTKISDAGLTHLKRLPQLRSLSLENATITDAGLTQLKDLTNLESLSLKGTQVTDAAVQRIQRELPKVVVER